MVKNTRPNPAPKRKDPPLGLTLLFIAFWIAITILIVRSNVLSDVFGQLDTTRIDLAVSIILLTPIAVAVFPLMYRFDEIYPLRGSKGDTMPAWKRYLFSILGTGVILGVVYYLSMMINVVLYSNFGKF